MVPPIFGNSHISVSRTAASAHHLHSLTSLQESVRGAITTKGESLNLQLCLKAPRDSARRLKLG